MPTLTSYDGGVVTSPQKVVRPTTVAEIQDVLRRPQDFPGPVRPMGSFHSLTPCGATPGTIVDMRGMNRILKTDPVNLTLTAEAGIEMIEAAGELRKQNLQFLLNIEIGNLTLGSAACCHTKDSLDAVEFGQISSYITAIKWVSPTGSLEEASADRNPALLPLIKSSYGLAGIIYEVTIRIKPMEIVRFNYLIHESASLAQPLITDVIAANQCMVCWTIGRTTVIQTRNQATRLEHEWLAESRRFGWNFLGAFLARGVRQLPPGSPLAGAAEEAGTGIELGFYRMLSRIGGFTLRDPDKMIDYSKTPPSGRYAFSFWAFPREDWVQNLHDYLDFADAHFAAHGFRCNLPLGSYFVRRDQSSLLSYSHDGDVISLDPIHAPGERDRDAWARFLDAFNAWAHQRGGIPLLNQSPRVTREQASAAYGARWKTFSDWVRSVDPQGRLRNEFFDELLVS
jgi:FAD/FMN-containing dehydrogenase